MCAILTIDWHHAPLPRSQSQGMCLTWWEVQVLADIAEGIDLGEMERRLAAEGESIHGVLTSVWTKWCALNLARDRLAATWEWRRR